MAKLFPNATVVGVDKNVGYLKKAKQAAKGLKNVHFVEADIRPETISKIYWKTGITVNFQFVLSVLHHMVIRSPFDLVQVIGMFSGIGQTTFFEFPSEEEAQKQLSIPHWVMHLDSRNASHLMLESHLRGGMDISNLGEAPSHGPYSREIFSVKTGRPSIFNLEELVQTIEGRIV
jgi:hypothetical protein